MTARCHVFVEDGKVTLVIEGRELDRENTLRAVLEIFRHEWKAEGQDFFRGVEIALEEMKESERSYN